MSKGVVIVGGGPAGLATARAYREAGGEGTVAIVTNEPHLPYERPPLTKEFLRGELDAGELPIEDHAWFVDHSVTVEHAAVEGLDVRRHEVSIRGGGAIAFDACVLATGSANTRINVPGAHNPSFHDVRTVDDSIRLAANVGEGTRVAVVGSGFIGCEAAASLALRGGNVTLVSDENLPQERRLGRAGGERIASWLDGYGVALEMGAEVSSIESSYESVVVTDSGETRADVVLFATGVRPRTELAEEAGLVIEEGAVRTDAALRTSAPDVWAVGDIAYAFNPAAGRNLRVEHWGEALNHGRVAGSVIAGREAQWDVAPGFWSTIGKHMIKYVAWGDGWDDFEVDETGGGFAITYFRGDDMVGVLTHERDDEYERGRALLERGPAGG